MTTGWPFLVARGRRTGYRLLLAPAVGSAGALATVVRGEVPPDGPSAVTHRDGLAIVHRTYRPTAADVGGAGAAPLRDRAGRPLMVGYGFACPGGTVVDVDERDLDVAREAAIATFRRFFPAEADFAAERSHGFPLRSTVIPDLVGQAEEPGPAEGAGPTERAVPGERAERAERAVPASPGKAASAESPGRAVGRARVRPSAVVRAIVTVATAVVLLGGAAAVWFASRPERVPVPDVTGLAPRQAQQRLDRAGLQWVVSTAAPANCRPGLVAVQAPAKGIVVVEESVVRLVVCPG